MDLDELGLERFAVAGHCGASSHALACAAQLTGRILGVVAIAALVPFDAEGLDRFAGMGSAGVRTLRAAADGRTPEAGDDLDFTAADRAMVDGPWAWFSQVVEPGSASCGSAPARGTSRS
ncbi:alpha/beta fold hydrolase [Actinoplanes sp. NPDC049681]|uniref:alpha/beta fold hydrolase n=1 Tax=Actinoplanes sp. NPDC049681 TaxID=3363905 RepID=UPI0037B271C7